MAMAFETERPTGRRTAVRRLSASPWSFAALYLGWAYLFWSPLPWSDSSVWSGTNLVLFLVGGASPLLAAVLLSWRAAGRSAAIDLGRRLVAVRRIAPRWWVLALLFWPVFYLLVGAAAVLVGVTDTPFEPDWQLLGDPRALAFPLLLSFVLPAAEEVGLRGWYLDRLQERYSITVAALVNGVTWAVWHAPFVWFPAYYANTTFDPELSWWMPMIVLDAVLIVWVYLGAGRSIFAALVFHGMMNLTGELLGITADMYPFMLLGLTLAAASVVRYWHHQAKLH